MVDREDIPFNLTMAMAGYTVCDGKWASRSHHCAPDEAVKQGACMPGDWPSVARGVRVT